MILRKYQGRLSLHTSQQLKHDDDLRLKFVVNILNTTKLLGLSVRENKTAFTKKRFHKFL